MTYVHYFKKPLVGIAKINTKDLRIFDHEGIQVSDERIDKDLELQEEIKEWAFYCTRHYTFNVCKEFGLG